MPIDPVSAPTPDPLPGAPPPAPSSAKTSAPAIRSDSIEKNAKPSDPFGDLHAMWAHGTQAAAATTATIGRGAAAAAETGASVAEGAAVGGTALLAGAFVVAVQSPAGEDPSSLRDHATPAKLDLKAHPPQNSTTVTPNQTGLHESLTASRTPANAAPAISTHTGHDGATPAPTSRHTTPIDTDAARGSKMTTPIHETTAADAMTEARKPIPVGPNNRGEFNGTADSAFTIQRASELKSDLGKAHDFGSTMAVAVAHDSAGNRKVLVSTNMLNDKGKPILRVPLKEGETAIGGDVNASNHDAETNIAHYAKANGYKIDDIAATRPMCSDCEKEVLQQSSDAHISTPRTGLPPVSRSK